MGNATGCVTFYFQLRPLFWTSKMGHGEEEEAEARQKLSADIVKYQEEASISSSTDQRGKGTDGTLDAIVRPIASGKIKLLEFIEALGPTITTKDPLVRAKSVRLLSLTLGRLAIDTALLDSEIDHLFSFLLQRLQDHHLIAPAALLGLRALSSSSRLSLIPSAAVILLQAIFQHVDVQSLAQIDRFSVYVIFRNLLANHLVEIKTRLGPNFVQGFIQCMDGEKDPRNLVVCFQLSEKISQTFPLGAFAEEMFEVVACYFPIDFTPPKSDPFGITKEMLVEGLQRALTASRSFAPFCTPLIIEKLSSDLTSAKIDALHLLTAAAPIFGLKGIRDHMELLIVDMRREMFLTTSDAVLVGIETAASALTSTVATDAAVAEYPELLPHLAAMILKECSHYLTEPQNRLQHPASKFLLAFCQGSPFIAIKVVQSVLPPLLSRFESSPQVNSRCAVVEVIVKFLQVLFMHVPPTKVSTSESGDANIPKQAKTPANGDIAIEEVPSKPTPMEVDRVSEGPEILPFKAFENDGELSDLRDPISIMMQTCLNSGDERLCKLGIETAECCIKLPFAIEDQNLLKIVVATILKIVIEHSKESIWHRGTWALCNCRVVPFGTFGESNMFDEVVLPLMTEQLIQAIARIKENAPIPVEPMDTQKTNSNDLTNLLEVLSTTCKTEKGFSTACDQLLSAVEDHDVGDAVGVQILQCINKLTTVDNKTNANLLKTRILPRIKSLFVDDFDTTSWLQQKDVIEQAAHIVQKAIKTMSEEEARQEWRDTKDLIVYPALKSPASMKSHLFPIGLPVGASLPRTSRLHEDGELVKTLLEVATTECQDADMAISSTKLIASIINKVEHDTALPPILEAVNANFSGLISINKARLCVWTTKALILRSHRMSKQMLSQLVTWLSPENPDLARWVGRSAFVDILRDFNDSLSPSQHTIIRKMYKQRFFLQAISMLINEGDCEGKSRENRLNAVASMLPHVPQQALLSELPTLLPVLVSALGCGDRELQRAVVEALQLLLSEAPATLAPHVDTLVPRLVGLAQGASNMEARAKSLRCLRVMVGPVTADGDVEVTGPGFAPALLMPLKPAVIKGLSVCIDDKKRLVRKEAVLTRNKWFLI